MFKLYIKLFLVLQLLLLTHADNSTQPAFNSSSSLISTFINQLNTSTILDLASNLSESFLNRSNQITNFIKPLQHTISLVFHNNSDAQIIKKISTNPFFNQIFGLRNLLFGQKTVSNSNKLYSKWLHASNGTVLAGNRSHEHDKMNSLDYKEAPYSNMRSTFYRKTKIQTKTIDRANNNLFSLPAMIENLYNISQDIEVTNIKLNKANYTLEMVAYVFPNSTHSIEKLDSVQELMEHSMLKYLWPKVLQVCVKLQKLETNQTRNNTFYNASIQNSLPIVYKVQIKSYPVLISEEEYQNSMLAEAINKEFCYMDETNNTVKCLPKKPKSVTSLARMSDFWFKISPEMPISSKLLQDPRIFTYQPAWIVGLSVIGGIIGVFFFGCIIAICYTRRPYRKSGKVYELEHNPKVIKNIPQIPAIHPSTKTSFLNKNKEMLYQ